MANEITTGTVIRFGVTLNSSAFSQPNAAIISRLPRDLRYEDDLMNNRVFYRDRYLEIESTAASEWRTKRDLLSYMYAFLKRYQWSFGRVAINSVIRAAPRKMVHIGRNGT
jgi:antirestriction protein ArdC